MSSSKNFAGQNKITTPGTLGKLIWLIEMKEEASTNYFYQVTDEKE